MRHYEIADKPGGRAALDLTEAAGVDALFGAPCAKLARSVGAERLVRRLCGLAHARR